MRAKRGKQYKKLLKQFELHFKFREPYQCLVDADIVLDSHRFAMDLVPALSRTLQGKEVKPFITECCIRHLYARASEPGMRAIIDKTKTFERRRCGHHPKDYPEPLSTLECLTHVVDADGKGVNKHKYVVCSQDVEVRRRMRAVKGVPLIYIARSVMILEPMADASAAVGLREEKRKFRAELLKPEAGQKRKRGAEEGGNGDEEEDEDDESDASSVAGKKQDPKKKKKTYGVKGPNPLSVKKKKKGNEGGAKPRPAATPSKDPSADEPPKKKRKRRGKGKGAAEGGEASLPAAETAVDAGDAA